MEREDLERAWRDAGGEHEASPRALPEAAATMFGVAPGAADDLLGADLAVIGLALGGPSDAAAAVRTASQRYSGWLAHTAADTGVRVVDYGDVPVDSADRGATFMRAHERIADILAAGAAPLVLGGTAVVTTPVLQVLAGKLRGRLGIVAFAPRLDLEIGTAGTLASRWAQAIELGVCEPATMVVIGERGAPCEQRARRVARNLGLRSYSVADVCEAGIVAVAREALAAATAGTESIYVSADLSVVEGVDDPVGLRPSDLSVAFGMVCRARLAGADLCGVRTATRGGVEDPGGAAALAARLAADLVIAVGSARA